MRKIKVDKTISKLVIYLNALFKTTKPYSPVFCSLRLVNSLLSNKLFSCIFCNRVKVIYS